MLQRLTPYAVEFRYDDQAAPLISHGDAKNAVQVSVEWITDLLGSRQ